MPIEICPHCKKELEFKYGKNVPCKNCKRLVDVFDDEHPLDNARQLDRKSTSSGYSATYLNENVSRRTELHEGHAGSSIPSNGVTYRQIGGLDEVIAELDLIVNGAQKYPELWQRLGRKKTRGVLLYGPPGCGKTLIAQALAHEARRKVCLIQGSEIKGWRQGAGEGNLTSAYESVRPNGILIIDEIDAIGGKRDHMVNEVNASIVGTLCSILDGAKNKDDVIIVATTNKLHMLDDALRRPGRFDVEIQISPPNAKGRVEIFRIHTKNMPLAEGVDLDEIANKAHGFTGADIAHVSSRISQRLLKEAVTQLKQGVSPTEIANNLLVTQTELEEVTAQITPSLLRENYMEIAKVTWEDIGGLEKLKDELRHCVVWPTRYAREMQTLKLRQPKGILLYGPPGCGKTLIARAMARESEVNFLVVNGPALLSMWVGSTEEAIRDIFGKARLAQPCIIFFDEIESIAPVRGRTSENDVLDRAVGQLLTEIDGVQAVQNVFVMAATNRPDLVDPALLRPGRLDLQFEVPLPDSAAREKIFKIHLEGTPMLDIDFAELAMITDGFSGAQIEWMCAVAKQETLERHILSGCELIVLHDDLLNACAQVAQRKY
ncbi:MAG: AAA family ATPase [Candidatus Spechtbacteria bacterium]|nr:AAA family ATPase [Candidatus Spechtbacteria bacterium]